MDTSSRFRSLAFLLLALLFIGPSPPLGVHSQQVSSSPTSSSSNTNSNPSTGTGSGSNSNTSPNSNSNSNSNSNPSSGSNSNTNTGSSSTPNSNSNSNSNSNPTQSGTSGSTPSDQSPAGNSNNSPTSPLPVSPSSTSSASPTAPTPPPQSPSSGSTDANKASNSTSPANAPANAGTTNSTTNNNSPKAQGNAESPSSSLVVVTITRTGADGVVFTSVASTASPLPQTSSSPSSSSSSSSSTTWAIIGGVVGGLVLLGSVVFIVFRCTQRRFSELDDEDVAIKWPELVTRTDDPSTLNPLAARHGMGHGVGDEPEDEKPGRYTHDLAALPSDHSMGLGMYDHSYSSYHATPGYGEPNGYSDDPYLGPSAAPQPYPQALDRTGYEDGAPGGYLHGNDQSPYYSQPPLPHHQHHIGNVTFSAPAGSAAGSHDFVTNTREESDSGARDLHRGGSNGYRSSWEGTEVIPLTVVNSSPLPPHSSS